MSKTLAEILVHRGVITKEELQSFQNEAKEKKISLDIFIKNYKNIPEQILYQAYGEKFGIPVIFLITEKMVPVDLIAKIPLRFLRDNSIIPILDEHNKIIIVTANPFNFQPLDNIKFIFGTQVSYGVAPDAIIIEALNKFYPLEGTRQMIAELSQEEEISSSLDIDTVENEDIISMASEAPIIKLVNHILYQAIKQNASDIHVEIFEKDVQVRYRIDGILHNILTPPKRAQAALISRIKIMANLNIAEKRQPQDGRIQLKVADRAIDVRVSILPVIYGERIVMRLLDKSKTFGELSSLGFNKRDFSIVSRAITQPNGILLITGPTGSGKTSTLYAILNKLNQSSVNIITVEDPVEYQMTGIGQVQVKEKIGLTFATALRAILRQDPDIIMIGETRDYETAQIAIQASLTGHLVLSTLHTNSAAATITRLIDMGIEPFLIASTITAVIAQRLVRRLCDTCKKLYNPDIDLLKRFNFSTTQKKNVSFYQAIGCENCLHTGYRGRIPIFEVMEINATLSHLILKQPDTTTIQINAQKNGMTLLVEDGFAKVVQGLTTLDEVLSEATAITETIE